MIGKGRYVPQRGDFIWIDLNPQKGSEQAGHRPAFVLSPREYNRKTGLCVLCPLTRQAKGYAFEVPVTHEAEAEGAILADQVRTVDWRVRQTKFMSKASEEVLSQVVARINALIIDPDE